MAVLVCVRRVHGQCFSLLAEAPEGLWAGHPPQCLLLLLPYRCVHVLCFDQFVYQILHACGVVVCAYAVVRAGERGGSSHAMHAAPKWVGITLPAVQLFDCDVGFFDGIVYHQERCVCEVGIQDALHFVLQVAERVHANFQVQDAVALV